MTGEAPPRFKLAAALLGVALAVAAYGAFLLVQRWRAPPPICRACGSCPYVFELDPARADVGPDGLRDRAYAIPKPKGQRRILVLGDSVAYGTGVTRDQTFPKLLERRLDGVEVINSGVPGYSPYNELEYYLARGRAYQPDLVLVSICFNDVVNPGPHWNLPGLVVPAAAVPNPGRRDQGRWQTPPAVYRDGRRWPVFLSGETDLPIQVLLDRESPEWRWLRGIYRQLDEAVRKDGARLVLIVVPLRYQLRPDYPFLPQAEFARFAAEAGISLLDVLPALRQVPPVGDEPQQFNAFVDVHHLRPQGHEAVAGAIAELLRANPALLAPSRVP